MPSTYACARNDIDHRLTKPKHPWTNGQVERMNRTIKDATVKRFHYDTHDQLRSHLADFVSAYNFAKRLKTLKGLTPYEYLCRAWTKEPERFTLNPLQQIKATAHSRGAIIGVWGAEFGRGGAVIGALVGDFVGGMAGKAADFYVDNLSAISKNMDTLMSELNDYRTWTGGLDDAF